MLNPERRRWQYSRVNEPEELSTSGGAAWLTAEEESDCISTKKNKLHKEYIVIFSESMFVWLLQ